MKLYLIRHGQTDSNLRKVFNSKTKDLNETGIKQAENLGKIIKDIDYEVIFSSTLLRAKHTAEIVNVNNKEIILDERLAERDPGNLQGKTLETTDRDEYWNYYTQIQYGTSEKIIDLFKRVEDFISDLKQKHYNKVLVVAHSGVSKAFYAYFNGIPKDGKFLNLGLKNTEVKEYEI